MGGARSTFVGKSLTRREDRRLLRGEGVYVADMILPRMVEVAFARSPLPHAAVRSVDLTVARNVPGVVLALSGAEVCAALGAVGGQQVAAPKAWRERVRHRIDVPAQPLLATGKVHYVGEPYAAVIAADRYRAEDAAALVKAELDPLAPVADTEAALRSGAPILHDGLRSNVAAEFAMGKGDVGAALARAPRRIRRRFVHHRYAAMPMECRAVLADYDGRTDSLTVWSATQVVHSVRREVAAMLRMPEERVRCVAPDVGGGFGVKGHVYPEDILIPYLARRLRRPVRWIEDRHEHIVGSAHARDNVHDVEAGFDETGRILAIKDRFVVDSGAYAPVGAVCAANSAAHMLGPYDVADYESAALVVTTNKAPNAPYRGAGRPEAVFAMERLIDAIAAELDLDPVEIRLRNMIGPERMPFAVGLTYRDGVPIVYDSGDYPEALRRAVAALGGLEAFRRRQREGWRAGRYLGLGVACYTEGTGVGPFESATVRIDPSGVVAVSAGACSQGQGHETMLAQVAADQWSVDAGDVTVTVGDTAPLSMGYGTIASRSAVAASNAIVMASREVREKVLAIAAGILETPEADLELRDGKVGVKGVPDMTIGLAEIARAARPGWDHRRPDGIAPGLEATACYEPPTVTWSYAADATIVEIDRETGKVVVERLVTVHDAGVLINPMIAEGQVRGGLAQGVGGALMEEIVYDENAQILTGNLADYLIPSACDLPPIDVLHRESPSPLNPLGVKGLGEGGAIAPPAAIANAVCDALRPFRTAFDTTPIRSADVLRVFRADAADEFDDGYSRGG